MSLSTLSLEILEKRLEEAAIVLSLFKSGCFIYDIPYFIGYKPSDFYFLHKFSLNCLKIQGKKGYSVYSRELDPN